MFTISYAIKLISLITSISYVYMSTSVVSAEQLGMLAISRNVPNWWDRVGATPFNPDNSIDIAQFCNDQDIMHVNGDSTTCVNKWLRAGRDKKKHLFASNGVYPLKNHLVMFSNMHIFCESPEKTIFQKVRKNWRGKFLSQDFGDSIQHLQNVSIENCGFDMNGDPNNFASAFNFDSADHITFRGNYIFDSTGMRSESRQNQRQYLVIKNAKNILVELNFFSEGGRIKVGVPGQRIIIRNNKIDFVNDNGITVVSRILDAISTSNISEDILIYENLIKDPTGNGIFIGADGEHNGAGVTARRISVFDNIITGKVGASCILATLPDYTSEIFIANNKCDDISSPEIETRFAAGLIVRRTNNPVSPSKSISIIGNYIKPQQEDRFDNSALFIGSNLEACLLDNTVRNSRFSSWIKFKSIIYIDNNDWGGGNLRFDSPNIQRISDRISCYIPEYIKQDLIDASESEFRINF